ncbi:conserved oligomeric Golgi complex subunit 3 [Diachasma alloeum]|uniref:conserved oligomeric Golgi complex subunit 3 n=2 Tax=Diachasma alloeum TaxID=454923 RepID=UPI00073825D9|nr:conserved oligomeric Golgi complex subunit 3 [Diachasma alloeum]XP_015111967.1 conserved oligomeric Golgi complex subunit 3 [Diachasma alloeum]
MNLIKWDQLEDGLAPLSDTQRDWIETLEERVSKTLWSNSDTSTSFVDDHQDNSNDNGTITSMGKKIESCHQLLQYYASLESRYESMEYKRYSMYLEELNIRKDDCNSLCRDIDKALEDMSALSRQYGIVSNKTMSLHSATEQLISEQEKLNEIGNEITRYVKYFKEADLIMDKLESANLSVRSDTFIDITDKIDTNIDFMEKNDKFKESAVYLVKYRHCQSKVIGMMHQWIMNILDEATDSIMSSLPTESSGDDPTSPDADSQTLALLYGRFQRILPKIKPIITIIEKRSFKRQEYDTLLLECHQRYLMKRGGVISASVQKGLQSVKERYNGDHCSFVRHACSLLLHASIDEHRLFNQFFEKKSHLLAGYLEGLCTSLYDILRPSIIHINHLETLAEICCILRVEMLEEHVQNHMEALEGFGNICLQLLHDAQERLVFRTHLYLQSDILGYNPSPGDLAYPNKLKMMEDIAESLREENRQAKIKKISVSSISSVSSITSNNLELEAPKFIPIAGFDPIHKLSAPSSSSFNLITNSPADLHGMWYPTVRRTLVCLSRLYRCLDRPVFQSLSREAINFCIESIEKAKEKIEARATTLDALLFQVKHLLILREQIAPFQVDFTVKEYSLDFSKVKTAAFGLLERRSRVFALSNNALLEFLLEGAPRMKEHLIDSRKHVDSKLKAACQMLIQHCTKLLVDPIDKSLGSVISSNASVASPPGSPNAQKGIVPAKVEPQVVAQVVSEVLRLMKFQLPSIQQSMQLYLANRETESILFRPIRNNIVAMFTQLSQWLHSNYSSEEQLLIACPLPEQVSIMLSSSSLAHTSSNYSSNQHLEQQHHPVVTNVPTGATTV